MAKGKEDQLRRQIEILKAQIKSTEPAYRQAAQVVQKEVLSTPSAFTNPTNSNHTLALNSLDYAKIKSDLRKTLFFSVLVLAALFTLYISEPTWLPIVTKSF